MEWTRIIDLGVSVTKNKNKKENRKWVRTYIGQGYGVVVPGQTNGRDPVLYTRALNTRNDITLSVVPTPARATACSWRAHSEGQECGSGQEGPEKPPGGPPARRGPPVAGGPPGMVPPVRSMLSEKKKKKKRFRSVTYCSAFRLDELHPGGRDHAGGDDDHDHHRRRP